MKSIKIRHPGHKKETDEELGAAFRGKFKEVEYPNWSDGYLGQAMRMGEIDHTYDLGGNDGIKIIAISEEHSKSGLITLFIFEEEFEKEIEGDHDGYTDGRVPYD